MNVWYVYEVDYVWDEAKQKKVQKRRCIGKIDPETDQVIPNGKRGPARVVPNVSGQSDGSSGAQCSKSKSQRPGSSSSLLSRRKFEAKLQKLSLISTKTVTSVIKIANCYNRSNELQSLTK